MRTSTGRFVSYVDPDPDAIELFDIAHALSLSCRYCGQVTRPVNTAAHSVLVHDLLLAYAFPMGPGVVAGDLAKAALLHDAAEAYLGDVPFPLIQAIGEEAWKPYREIQGRLEQAIAKRFGFDPRHLHDPQLAAIDRTLPFVEMRLYRSRPELLTSSSVDVQRLHAWLHQPAQVAKIHHTYSLGAADARDLLIARVNGLT